MHIKKSRILSYTALLAAMLLWGCESGPGIGPEPGNEGEPLMIGNVKLSEYRTANTRAPQPSKPLTAGAEIGVSMMNTATGHQFVNRKYVYVEERNDFEPATPQDAIYTNGKECYGYIYYPYQEKLPEITIKAGVAHFDPELDIHRGCIRVKAGNKDVPAGIPLQHIWARLQVTLQLGKNYPGTCTVTNIQVRSRKGKYTAQIDRMWPPQVSGSEVKDMIQENIDNYFPGSIISDTKSGLTGLITDINITVSGQSPVQIADLMVPPIWHPNRPEDSSTSTINMFEMTIDGKKYTIEDTETLNKVNQLDPGDYKRLAITIDPGTVTISNVTLQAWEDMPLSPPGGDGNFYPQ